MLFRIFRTPNPTPPPPPFHLPIPPVQRASERAAWSTALLALVLASGLAALVQACLLMRARRVWERTLGAESDARVAGAVAARQTGLLEMIPEEEEIVEPAEEKGVGAKVEAESEKAVVVEEPEELFFDAVEEPLKEYFDASEYASDEEDEVTEDDVQLMTNDDWQLWLDERDNELTIRDIQGRYTDELGF